MRLFKSILCLALLSGVGMLFAETHSNTDSKAAIKTNVKNSDIRKLEQKAERDARKAEKAKKSDSKKHQTMKVTAPAEPKTITIQVEAEPVKAEPAKAAPVKAEKKAVPTAKKAHKETKAFFAEAEPVKAAPAPAKAEKVTTIVVTAPAVKGGEPTVQVIPAKDGETVTATAKVEVKKVTPAEIKAEIKAAPAAPAKAAVPAAFPLTKADLVNCMQIPLAIETDEVFDFYISKTNGHVYMVYSWNQPMTIYSLSMAKGNKLNDGSEVMTIKPDGRTKGKVKMPFAMVVEALRPKLGSSSILQPGDVVGEFSRPFIYHDSLKAGSKPAPLPTWGECFQGLWESTGIHDIIQQTTADFANTWVLGLGRVIMMMVALVLIYLAIVKEFEPLLLLPIGFGALLANIPLAGIAAPGGLQYMIFEVGINSGVFPLLIFMGVGAMTDFGPMIANPKTALLGGAAQFGIFSALLGALALNVVPGIEFNIKDAASIGIIGGADGPTSIFLTSRLSPSLLGAIAVAAYSYMALVPIIQPPIMKMLTTDAEKKIRMGQLRPVSKIEKICFPLLITFLCAFLLPDAAPLMGMLMFGNLMRECGVVERLNDTAQNALINIVTIFLGIAVGSKLSAEQFLSAQTLGILVLGCLAFCIGTGSGVIMAKIMNLFSKDKINPLIGAAGVSAVPMAARVVNKVGLSYDSQNFLLMQAMGPNVSGVIGSAVAAGVLLKLCGGL